MCTDPHVFATYDATSVLTLRQVARRDAKIDRIRGASEGAQANPSPPTPLPLGDEEDGSEEEEARVIKNKLLKQLKPSGQYGENCARMCQKILEQGVSMNAAGPIVRTVLEWSMDLDTKKVGIALDGETVKVLALGISELDAADLRAAILEAPFLLIAGDESQRHGDKKYPVFLSFWHRDAPWWGLFRVCNIPDKTAETQASVFYDIIVNDLKYPRERVLYVLSDNTASVSAEVGGCVALLQRKLRGEDTTSGTKKGKGRAPAGGRKPSAQASQPGVEGEGQISR